MRPAIAAIPRHSRAVQWTLLRRAALPACRPAGAARRRLHAPAALPDLPLFSRAAGFAGSIPHPAIISHGKNYSYAQLLRDAAAFRDRLLETAGTKDLAEQRVAFLCPNAYEYAVVQWGVWAAGGVAVPISTHQPAAEMEYTIENSESSLVVVHSSFEAKIAPVVAKEGPFKVLHVDDHEPREVPAAEAQFSLSPFDINRRALFIYTSGTTGKPKGVVHSHKSVHSNIRSLVEAWKWSSNDAILHTLPLNHVHGIVNILLCALYSGATCEFHPSDAPAIWKRFASPEPLTLFMAVPTIYSRLAQAYRKMDLTEQRISTAVSSRFRVMVSGSAPLPTTMFEEWVEVSGGQRLLERYGMSEIGMALGNPLEGERVPGTVGVPFPGVRVKLASVEDGANVTDKVDTPGEILVKGDNVFVEYWKRPDATKEVFDEEGWFKTGDIAVRMPNGYFRILGRASMDIIKSGGYKISALEIEREIFDHPAVKDCAVCGIPDEEWGERVAVVMVPKEGKSISLSKLRHFLKDRLATYKLPTRMLTIEGDMPRNPMGKVNKKLLVKELDWSKAQR
ncbi:AMP-dependent synthetase and ligase [Hyaloraphidium curvatum]|nr:AMP-dependent synthetase and ligase [Hyaloraphidium curvatum]